MKRIVLVLGMLLLLGSCKERVKRYDEKGVPYVRLQKGVYMPELGLGTYAMGGGIAYAGVLEALKVGYRHIDTAHAYHNEADIGRAVRESGVPREQIWVSSKLWPTEYGRGATRRAIDRMLERFGLEYLDLLMLHHPLNDYRGAWQDMEEAVREGKVRALGICNFDRSEEAYKVITEQMEIKPAVHQIECHPYAQRRDILKRDAERGIVTACWYPTGSQQGEILADSTIVAIAHRHSKTPAQVVLRWHIEQGRSIVPAVHSPNEMDSFIDIFDFELSDEERGAIDTLERNTLFDNTTLEEMEYLTIRFPLIDIL